MTQTTIDRGDVLELLQEQSLPKIFQAKKNELNLTVWTRENRAYLEDIIVKNGAILFRGFAMHQPADLEELVSSLTPGMLNYIEGSSPRTRLTDKVYTSTEYPPEFEISMHNELSYAHKWPSRLFFFCMTTPQTGGETPLVDSRKIYQTLDKAILETFITKGVKYIRNLHGGRGVGLSWQTVFETDDRAQVELYCEEGDIEYQWTRKGGLRTSQLRPAAIKHPVTKEPLWFNQVDQWHPTNLPEATRHSMLEIMSEKDLSINATYGDGTPLEVQALDHIRNTTRQATTKFPWQKGDVLLVDNTLVAHGRSAFSGPRKIVLAMGGTVSLSEVEVIKTL
ncbi:protein AmbD [Dictyobacter alpinus]|uniref:Protein AmbD n=1 Tax=Dictyobacter alpinus TaxID=2014873 RepID=A0A402BB02_9CHLR|nr:TauD/TfdA family dioxygenase [Dictyobacter alpinus]GCE28509.1 protein AmbD [Dictyobacter alpinus]